MGKTTYKFNEIQKNPMKLFTEIEKLIFKNYMEF